LIKRELTYNQQLAAATVAGASLVVLMHWLTSVDLFLSWLAVLTSAFVVQSFYRN
jgi:Na+/H+-dicarboxylate symporter